VSEKDGAATALDVRATKNGVRLRVRVQPRASRETVAGVRDGVLLVRLTAPPVEGAANAALIRLLSRKLRVPGSAVTIVRGGSARDKLVEIYGVGPFEVIQLAQTSSR
jgi:uncharacterized protein (TIGR00251 family)